MLIMIILLLKTMKTPENWEPSEKTHGASNQTELSLHRHLQIWFSSVTMLIKSTIKYNSTFKSLLSCWYMNNWISSSSQMRKHKINQNIASPFGLSRPHHRWPCQNRFGSLSTGIQQLLLKEFVVISDQNTCFKYTHLARVEKSKLRSKLTSNPLL